MSKSLLAGWIAASLFLSGCADFVTPVAVLAPKPEHDGIEPDRFGVACAHRILGMFSFGNSRVAEAKKNGGIVDIATVEVQSRSLFFQAYLRQCTEVAGYA